MINDDLINAFTAGGQTVQEYHPRADPRRRQRQPQVQGVIAHELGHIADGHVILQDAGVKPAIGITLLSMVLGLAAMAAGRGRCGRRASWQQGEGGGGGQVPRLQPRSGRNHADATGAKFLRESGISGRGMLTFFKKLQNEEYAYGLKNIDPYAQSHPLSGERIATSGQSRLASPVRRPEAVRLPDLALEDRFKRVKAKLEGYVAPYQQTLNDFPDSDQSIYAHYARAYAWHKAGYPDKADAEADALVRALPHDPYFLEIKGQILLEVATGARHLARCAKRPACRATRR